jgi:Coenzyme PQQ synthesis protein D (PqqD)
MKPAEHVRANVTDDGLVILDIDKGEIYSANVVAARIWNLLMDGKSEQEAVDAVAAEFDAPKDVVARDAHAFIESLVAKSLVDAAPPAVPAS